MSRVLTVISNNNTVSAVEIAFRKELPRVQFKVISKEELFNGAMKQTKADMVIIEKGLSNTETINLIREIRSVSKAPIVLMATEKDAANMDTVVSNKYESIFETSQKDKLPTWLKQFYGDSSEENHVIKSK